MSARSIFNRRSKHLWIIERKQQILYLSNFPIFTCRLERCKRGVGSLAGLPGIRKAAHIAMCVATGRPEERGIGLRAPTYSAKFLWSSRPSKSQFSVSQLLFSPSQGGRFFSMSLVPGG